MDLNNTFLGIELGSTRIKAVLIDETTPPSPPAALLGKTDWRRAYGSITSKMRLREFAPVIPI